MKILEHLKDIDQAVEDAFLIHEKFERHFNKHRHQKGQLSFVEDGVVYLEVDNQHFVIPAKHYVWIPKDREHQLRVSYSATQLHSFYFANTEGKFYEKFGIYPASNLIIELIKFSERWNQQFINFHQPLANVLKTLFELIALQPASVQIKLPIANSTQMEAITDYIQANYAQSLSLQTMTEQFNMSERSFCRLFKKSLNTTFLQYLKTVRVINAIELLVKTNMSIYEIANAVGYESLSAFSTIFLEYTHKRPQEMRNHLVK